jgi:TorA maturation chaperone TorD
MTQRSEALQKYGFIKDLSACLMRPSFTLAQALCSGALHRGFDVQLDAQPGSPLAAALEKLAAYSAEMSRKPAEEVRLALEVEYNRLFVGPDKVPALPYESYYQKDVPEVRLKTVKGPAERAVREVYHAFGLAMPGNATDFADHIAVELDFLSYLCLMEARAWADENQDEVERLREGYDAFLANHLLKWFPAFEKDVLSNVQLPFYEAIIGIISHTVLAV